MQSDKITIQDIIDMSVPHGYKESGRRSTIETERFILSIVGGSSGLYGDFKDTFEVPLKAVKSKNESFSIFIPDFNLISNLYKPVSSGTLCAL